MLTPELVTDTVLEWFENLDYEYMVLHIIVCYGLYYADNLRWIVEYFSPVRKKGISRAVWFVGGILAAIEMFRFIPVIVEHDMSITLAVEKLVSILHSYIVIQVFVEPVVTLINNWLGVFRRTTSTVMDIKSEKKIKSERES